MYRINITEALRTTVLVSHASNTANAPQLPHSLTLLSFVRIAKTTIDISNSLKRKKKQLSQNHLAGSKRALSKIFRLTIQRLKNLNANSTALPSY